MSEARTAGKFPSWTRIWGSPLTPAQHLQHWADWQKTHASGEHTTVLHDVVVLEPHSAAPWLQAWQTQAAPSLLSALQDLPAGIHRLAIVPGHIYLTVCHMPWADALAELQCQANEWHIPTHWLEHASLSLCKALANLSAWQAQLHLSGNNDASNLTVELQAWLRQTGWDEQLRYTPVWKTPSPPHSKTQHWVVIGAGLSGAAIAHAMALRGARVTVLEQATALGAGASGLPAGLVVPYISADDNPRARLTRAGVRWMLQHLRQHLSHAPDAWAHSGVEERDVANGTSRWHAQAAWVQPQAIVKQWLRTPGVELHLVSDAEQVVRVGKQWHVLDKQGNPLAQADHIVLANASDAARLLQAQADTLQLPNEIQERVRHIQAVHGTLSWAHQAPKAHWPAYPVNGKGNFISQARYRDQAAWMAGSTFETDSQLHRAESRIAPLEQQHEHNMQRLQQLLPDVAADLAPAFASGEVSHWSATRCTSQDRLPLVGALYDDTQQGLWIVAAMGARGISLSALAAEWIAAQVHHEPWPLERSLVRSMDVHRPRRKRGGKLIS